MTDESKPPVNSDQVLSHAERLRVIMRRYKLSYKRVGELLYVPLPTVTAWLRPPTNRSFRQMPLALLELLEFKAEKYLIPVESEPSPGPGT